MDATKSKALFVASMLLVSFFLILPLAYAGDACPTSSKSKSPVVSKPPVTVPPPITMPPPMTVLPPVGGKSLCPTRPPVFNPPPASCPVESLKVGARVDLLGGLVHIEVGDPVGNQSCQKLQGLLDLVELEAAVCLCTAIKLKLLNVHLALQLPLTCGKDPPPGYTNCTV